MEQVWRRYQILSEFLTNGHLPRVLCQSHLSDNNNGNNEVTPEAVHISPDIYINAEKKTENFS